MRKVKVISLIVTSMLLVLFGVNYYLQPKAQLDLEVLKVPLSKTHLLVGYRNNDGNATVSFTYNFYLLDKSSELPAPFLITNTPDVKVDIKSPTEVFLSVEGKVYKFTNIVWLKEKGRLFPVSIEFIARN